MQNEPSNAANNVAENTAPLSLAPSLNAAVSEVLNNEVETTSSEVVTDFIEQRSIGELARLIESVPAARRVEIWQVTAAESRGPLLVELHQEALKQLALDLPNEELYEAVESLSTDDLAWVIDVVPNDMSAHILEQLSAARRSRIERVLSFDEDSAMRLLDHDVIEIRRSMSVANVLDFIRELGGLPPATDKLMVVGADHKLMGVVPLGTLLGTAANKKVVSLMEANYAAVSVNDDRQAVARLFEDRDLVSAPVVDEQGGLLGRITVDDVLDIIQQKAEKPAMQMAGLKAEADLFAPILKSARNRAIWLGINLITAFLAAGVIGLFTEALDKIVALAILMPVVASMGGIAGSQTLTLTIRGMALGQISAINSLWLAKYELAIGALNGVLWAIVVGAAAWAFFDAGVASTLSIAILVNLLAAAIAGVAIPLLLKKMGQDPALSGAVILTTVTDVVGFATFLGLSSLLLL